MEGTRPHRPRKVLAMLAVLVFAAARSFALGASAGNAVTNRAAQEAVPSPCVPYLLIRDVRGAPAWTFNGKELAGVQELKKLLGGLLAFDPTLDIVVVVPDEVPAGHIRRTLQIVSQCKGSNVVVMGVVGTILGSGSRLDGVLPDIFSPKYDRDRFPSPLAASAPGGTNSAKENGGSLYRPGAPAGEAP